MKYLSIIILLGIAASSAFAQNDSITYLSRVPSLPSNPCSMTQEEKEQYLNEVNIFDQELLIEIRLRKKAIETNMENSKEQMTKYFAKESGLSDPEMQKLKNKNMNEAEKNKMIDKMLNDKANLSMDEVNKLKKMSKEGRQAWIEAYYSEQMLTAQTNQDSGQTQQTNSMTLYELTSEQQSLLQIFSVDEQNFINQLDELDKENTIGLKELKDATGMEYCKQINSRYYDILNNRIAQIKFSIADYNRFEELTSEINYLTAGINQDASGFQALQAIEGYVSELKSIFKYVYTSN